MVVARKQADGTTKLVKLKGHAMQIEVPAPRNFSIDTNATPQQVKLRKAWLG